MVRKELMLTSRRLTRMNVAIEYSKKIDRKHYFSKISTEQINIAWSEL